MSLPGYTIVYGGSFDPPHLSHQMTCLYLLEVTLARKVWLVPSFNHPFAKPLSPFSTRAAMCACLARPFGAKVEVLDIEAELGGAGRTYDTLLALRARHPEVPLALAIGADIVAETSRWYRWPDIAALVPVVVVGRTGFARAEPGLDLPAVASRELRDLARRGQSLRGWVPDSVAQIVEEHGLYRTAGERP